MPASAVIDVNLFSRYFTDKVVKVHLVRDSTSPPIFSSVQQGVSFSALKQLTTSGITEAIWRPSDKSSDAYPMSTTVLKQTADFQAPCLTELYDRSPAVGHVPSVYKHALITPIVKKAGLDTEDVSSYRPISNWPVPLERLVAGQLMG